MNLNADRSILLEANMLVIVRHRNLILIVPIAALLYTAFWCNTAHANDQPEVQGVIATEVQFSGASREKVANAVFELLGSCTFSAPASEKEWGDAPNQKCRIHVKFVKPHTVTVNRSEKVEVDEMVITFPLSNGRIWVRSGDKYISFAKYRPELCKPIQELLREAIPVGLH